MSGGEAEGHGLGGGMETLLPWGQDPEPGPGRQKSKSPVCYYSFRAYGLDGL